jgi:hypothetical protein
MFVLDTDDLHDIRDTLDAVVTNNYTVEQVLDAMDTLHTIIEGLEEVEDDSTEVQASTDNPVVPETASEAV